MGFDGSSIGFRLKRLRSSKGMTAKEVAEKMGVSPSYISMLENGKSNYSLKTLMKLMSIYGETLSDFLKSSKSTGRVHHLSDMEQLSEDESKMDYRTIRAEGDPNVFRPSYIHLAPGGTTGFAQHVGTECIIAVEGSIVVSLVNPETGAQEDHTLQQWDSIFYTSDWAHCAHNESDEPATLILVFSPYEEQELPDKHTAIF